MKVRQYINKYEKAVFTSAMLLFFGTGILNSVLSEIFPAFGKHKIDIMFATILSAVTIIFTMVRNIEASRAKKPMLLPYTSTTADMSEIETQLERFKECELLVLGDSLTTMWNSLLKKYFDRVRRGDLPHQNLKVVLIKTVKSISTFEKEKDPVVPLILAYKYPPAISLSIYVTDQTIHFTGICANKEFLRFRLLNTNSRREVLGRAFKGDDEVENRIIEWFCNSFEEIKIKSLLVDKL